MIELPRNVPALDVVFLMHRNERSRAAIVVRLALVAAALVASAVAGVVSQRAVARANPAHIWVLNSNVALGVHGSPVDFTSAADRGALYSQFDDMQYRSDGQIGVNAAAIAVAGAPIIIVQTDGSQTAVSLNGRGLTCNEIAPTFQADVCGSVPVTDSPDPTDHMIVYQVTNAGTHNLNDSFVVTATNDSVTLDSIPLYVVGQAHDITLSAVAEKTTIQQGSFSCHRDADVTGPAYAGVIANYIDIDGTPLVGYGIYGTWSSSSVSVLSVAQAVSMSSVNPETGGTIGDYNVVCGSTNTGRATLSVKTGQNEITGVVGIITRTLQFTVTGLPSTIVLEASPATLTCDGVHSSTVTATVRDADSNLVVDNTPVTFSVVALGTANPIQTKTTAGVASSVVTPFPGAVGDTVIVTSGAVQVAIGVLCEPPAPPAVPNASADGTTTTVQATFSGLPNVQYRIDLFSNATCGPPAGGTFMGSYQLPTDGVGVLQLTALLNVTSAPGTTIVATATDPFNYTSSVSGCETVAQRQCPGDTLCNGYTDAQKIALGKDPFTYCTIMRADVNGDHSANILDITAIASQFLQDIPPGNPRYDQNGDNKINILDITVAASVFLKNVSACP